jgi:hypothetical protein
VKEHDQLEGYNHIPTTDWKKKTLMHKYEKNLPTSGILQPIMIYYGRRISIVLPSISGDNFCDTPHVQGEPTGQLTLFSGGVRCHFFSQTPLTHIGRSVCRGQLIHIRGGRFA